ncbi:phage tail protein [Rossellomorea sp. BNER]|uniref:phage tail protein n=1 Tax=Rossellomorea sp. BNER TaxID=2962031 RepID=UPI003AF218FD|nr:hypothetical protein [Rossellomorea sp. BNER]
MEERLDAQVGAKISEFRKKMAEVKRTARKMPKKIVVNVEARIKKFQKKIDRIASSINSMNTLMSNFRQGSLITISPTLVPLLATIIGLLGTLGPMIGTIGGSAFALATAFGFAGTAAVAFGAAAIPTISKLFDETNKLTKAQKAAKGEYNKFKSTWQGIVKDLEKPVLQAFSKSMQIANKTLKMARPLFDSAAKAVNNLLNSLDQSLDSSLVKEFFSFMNKQAGPMLETLGKAGGNFIKGFMSMMTAFGPLASETAQGFLNMSKGFSEWAAGLSKSEKFQSFVNYIRENMPKIKSIFRDALAGITYFFSAFGPLCSDMMTGLQGLMAKFKEWSKSLKEDQSFQKFIQYIRDNAPKVISLIGNLSTFIANMGAALAPLGSKLLDIVNKFISWTNKMMEAHPIFGQVVAVLVVITGALIALAPNIIAVATLFGGLGSKVLAGTTMARNAFALFKNEKIIGLKMIGTSLKTFGTTLMTNLSKARLWATLMMTQMRKTATTWLVSMAKMVASAAKSAVKFVVHVAKMIGRWALLGAKSLLHAARVAAAWFIALGPVGWVIATVIALVALIIANWDKVKKWTSKIWNSVWNWIKETWNKAKSWTSSKLGNILSIVVSKFTSIVSSVRNKMTEVWNKVKSIWGKTKSFLEGINLYSIGKDIIRGLINGVGAMARSLVNKVGNVVGNAIDKAKRLLGIHSPSRVFMQIGKYTGEGMQIGMGRTIRGITQQSAEMARASIFEPQVAQFDTSGFEGVRYSSTTAIGKSKVEKVKSSRSRNSGVTNGDPNVAHGCPGKVSARLNVAGKEVDGLMEFFTEKHDAMKRGNNRMIKARFS